MAWPIVRTRQHVIGQLNKPQTHQEDIFIKHENTSFEIEGFSSKLLIESAICVRYFDRAYDGFYLALLCRKYSPYGRKTKSEAAELKEWVPHYSRNTKKY